MNSPDLAALIAELRACWTVDRDLFRRAADALEQCAAQVRIEPDEINIETPAVQLSLNEDGLSYALRRGDQWVGGSYDADETPLCAIDEMFRAASPSPPQAVAIAGNVPLLQAALDHFGPSHDGAVERDLALAKEQAKPKGGAS